jgi:MFS family permease
MGIGLVCFIIYMFYDKKYSPGRARDGKLAKDEAFRANDILLLLKNRGFLFITALCVTFYSAVFPFQAFCPDFLHNKFNLTLKTSGVLTSIIIWGTIVFTPIFGKLADKKGLRASLMIYGSIMLLISHLVLSLTNVTPYAAMFVLGIAFSLVPASMWPSVALIVEEKRLGTAYGLMTSIQNIGLFAFPILAGWITDSVNKGLVADPVTGQTPPLDYTYTILMFAGLGIVGLVFAFLLKREALRPGGPKLEIPASA